MGEREPGPDARATRCLTLPASRPSCPRYDDRQAVVVATNQELDPADGDRILRDILGPTCPLTAHKAKI